MLMLIETQSIPEVSLPGGRLVSLSAMRRPRRPDETVTPMMRLTTIASLSILITHSYFCVLYF
jgi:hypothetical protein